MNTFVLPIYAVCLLGLGTALILVPRRFQQWGARYAKGWSRRFIESPAGIANFRFCGMLASLMGGFLLWARYFA